MPRPRSLILASIACSGFAAAALLPVATATARAAGVAGNSATTAGGTRAVVSPRPGAIELGLTAPSPPTYEQCEARIQAPCYGPPQIEEAYGTPALYARGVSGQGQTIAIVESFGSPTIASDLATFDQAYGLPDPPSLDIIQPAGTFTWTGTPDQLGWARETTLDVEYAHAIAPGAKILLVETPVAETEGVTGFPQIVSAEEYVIDHHLSGVISQSFSATEQTFADRRSLLGLRGAYIDAYLHHVTVLGATGDDGATGSAVDGSLYPYPVVAWPASDPLVTAVGATQLSLDANGNRTSPDVAWSDSGGGVSSVFRRPAYQDGVAAAVGAKRGIPDISMSGSCTAPVTVYSSFTGTGRWLLTCGSSESTPIFAGIVALSDQVAHHWLGLINPALYELSSRHAPGIVDVTSGDNSQAFTQNGQDYTVAGYSAGPGYDLVTGVGTVYAPDFVPELARAAR